VEGPQTGQGAGTRQDRDSLDSRDNESNGSVNGTGGAASADTAAESPAPAEPTEPPAGDPPAAGKKRNPRKRKLVIAIVIIVVLAIAVGGGLYLRYTSQFVSTDNAQVDGDQIQINAPTTGTVTDWSISQGSQVKTNQVVGRIQLLGTGPQQVIKSPGNGTVAVTNVVNGAYVTGGTNLATAYDFNKIYITARVDETDIADVHVGAPVDLDVDAFPGITMSGIVQDVQGSSAGEFSLFPQDNSSGNFQKVTQVIPVKIELVNTGGNQLAPGMNVTVHIHKAINQ
jgi:multidrug resistance efflux pump